MRKLIVFFLFSLSSLCYAAFRTDALNVTGSSITINGTSYNWVAGIGTAGQCLMTDGNNPPTLTWGDCSGSGPTPTVYNYALLEDSTYILLEDSTKMLLEH